MSAALAASSVRRAYGDDLAVAGVDLAVAAGEVVALVGLNGAGKTTLLRLLLGMVVPDAGNVCVHGDDVATATSATWARVGHLVEAPLAWPELTVRENLAAAARLHGVPRDLVTTAVSDGIDRLGLGRWADRRARALSLGNRQRLGLACALVHDPDVVVLDEPANALDPAGVVFLRELLRERAGRGDAILVSSHHLDELARVADRILVLHRGQLVGTLDPGGVDLERRFFAMVHAVDEAGDRLGDQAGDRLGDQAGAVAAPGADDA